MIDTANALLLPHNILRGTAQSGVVRRVVKTLNTLRKVGFEASSEKSMTRCISFHTTAIFCLSLVAAAVVLRIHLERSRHPAPPVVAYVQPHHH